MDRVIQGLGNVAAISLDDCMIIGCNYGDLGKKSKNPN